MKLQRLLKNIQKHLRNAGVKVRGASPSVVELKIYFEVPAETIDGNTAPKANLLPCIKAMSSFVSQTGIPFSLFCVSL